MSFTGGLQDLLDHADTGLTALRHILSAKLLIDLVGGIVVWLPLRAANAVVGEYVKRFWFRHAHKDRLSQTDDALLQAQTDLRLAKEEICRLRGEIGQLRGGRPPGFKQTSIRRRPRRNLGG